MKTTVIEQLTALRLIIIRKTEKEKKQVSVNVERTKTVHTVGGNAN